MPGITSMMSHIITIALLWVAAIVIIQLIRISVLKGMKGLDEARLERAKKIFKLLSLVITVVAASVILLVALFLSNPNERVYEDMRKITPAKSDPDFIPPTKTEIDEQNREAVEEPHREKADQAVRENREAMDNAMELFDKIEKEAEQNNNAQIKEEKK